MKKEKIYTTTKIKNMIVEAFDLKDKLLYYICDKEKEKAYQKALGRLERTFRDVLGWKERFKIII